VRIAIEFAQPLKMGSFGNFDIAAANAQRLVDSEWLVHPLT
jgi:hypothetical protein